MVQERRIVQTGWRLVHGQLTWFHVLGVSPSRRLQKPQRCLRSRWLALALHCPGHHHPTSGLFGLRGLAWATYLA